MNNTAIEAFQLVKKFPQKKSRNNGGKIKGRKSLFRKRESLNMFTAVDGVDLSINQGEVFGLLGPNGAGKSTTIRMLCTLLEPTSGSATVNGFDIVKQAAQVRQSLGTLLAGERSIYWKLSGRENLEYFAALYHIPPKVAKTRIDQLLKQMEISDRADEMVEKIFNRYETTHCHQQSPAGKSAYSIV